MKKIQFDVPEARKIEINGHVFEILKSDAEVISKAAEWQNRYAKLTNIGSTQDKDIQELMAAIESVVGYVDEMLGEGATYKITNGTKLGIVNAVNLMSLIAQAVVEEYNDTVADNYGE